MKFLDLTGVTTLWTAVKSYVKTNITDKIGVASGIASLGADGKLTSSQMPSLKTVNGTSIVGSGDISIDLSLYKIVDSLPTTNIDANKIYLVVNADGPEGNQYDEYTRVNNKWELLGQYKADVDLAPYLKKSELATTTTAGVMASTDKSKLDGIAANATKDEAITTSELNSILV